MLTDRRQELRSRERIATVNRLHEVLTQLIPGRASKNLRASTARRLLSSVRPRAAVGKARKQLTLDYVGDLERLDAKLKDLKAQIAEAVAEQGSSLISIDGIGPLGAGKTLAEVIDVRRFANRDAYAGYTGTAPIDLSSGAGRDRLNRRRQPPAEPCPAPRRVTQTRRGPRQARTTSSASGTRARPTWKRSAPSNDNSATSSTRQLVVDAARTK